MKASAVFPAYRGPVGFMLLALKAAVAAEKQAERLARATRRRAVRGLVSFTYYELQNV